MHSASESLWRINQDYGQRLMRAQHYLDLLAHQIEDRIDPDAAVLRVIVYIRDRLTQLRDEHRVWRYNYFYETPDSKRIVQSNDAIRRAYTSFKAMSARHDIDVHQIAAVFYETPRPDTYLTDTANGDLWHLASEALRDLLNFNTGNARHDHH